MTARHREERTTVDMVPRRLRAGTKATAAEVGARYTTRPTHLNETGKLEWVYQPEVRHGAHDATPTIAEIAATEPCEKTTGWPATSCATRGDLRITSDEWATSYCLPCRIRAALDREQHLPVPDLYEPWPEAAIDVIRTWIPENTVYRHPENIEVQLNIDDGVRHADLTFTDVRGRWDRGTVDTTMPWSVAAKAYYIATGERL